VQRLVALLDRLVDRVVRAAMVLVLPVSGLLFLQWPLRDIAHAWTREANDLAQILFAFYVAAAVTYATRSGSHLAADAFARRYAPETRLRLLRIASLTVLIPVAAFILYTAWPAIYAAVRQLEAFPETFNPGYFIIKLCVGMFALLVLLQAIVDVVTGRGTEAE
jgi:TRAP-type mannitol/chloroaromatic compound transport system permease small subunit